MEVTCEYKLVPWFDVTRYVCYVSSGSVTQPRTQITKFIGNHIENRTNENVDAINIKNLVVNFFPRGIPNVFTAGIVNLKLHDCGLKEICGKDLQGLSLLQSVNFDCNKLRRLPDDLFIDTPRLVWISFDSNLLVSLTSKLLEPIEANDVQKVSFQNNPSINACYNKKRKHGRRYDYDDHDDRYDLENLKEEIDRNCCVKRTLDKSKDHYDGIAEHLKTGNLSDVVLKTGKKEFKAHKLILSLQSSVFAALFASKKKSDKIIISDVSAAAVEQFLTFINTGKVRNVVNLKDLFILASKYEISKLKEFCEDIIVDELNDSNASEMLELGKRYKSGTLIRAANDLLEPESGSEGEEEEEEEAEDDEVEPETESDVEEPEPDPKTKRQLNDPQGSGNAQKRARK